MQNRALISRGLAAGMVVGTLFGGQALTSVAYAATTSSTTLAAVQQVWLRSTPAIARNGVVLEAKNAQFTVVSGSTAGWWHVKDAQGRTGYVINNTRWIQPVAAASAPATNTATRTSPSKSTTASSSTTTYTTTTGLPRGVTLDRSITPIAPLTATWQQKFDAVLSVAQSKLGTKYVWGHNEDRGQYGFDCSNFTAYVYHHALGYKFSGASQVQNTSVGNVVPQGSMRPGDLLIFENGAHVGIYIGNGEMIQCGGGLGQVGYLSVKPGSYWGNHITSVRRMF